VLEKRLLGKCVHLTIYAREQYGRAVAETEQVAGP